MSSRGSRPSLCAQTDDDGLELVEILLRDAVEVLDDPFDAVSALTET